MRRIGSVRPPVHGGPTGGRFFAIARQAFIKHSQLRISAARSRCARRARGGWEATEMDIEESKGFGSRRRTRRSGGRASEFPGCPAAFQNTARHIGLNCRKVPVATAFEAFCERAALGLSCRPPEAPRRDSPLRCIAHRPFRLRHCVYHLRPCHNLVGQIDSSRCA